MALTPFRYRTLKVFRKTYGSFLLLQDGIIRGYPVNRITRTIHFKPGDYRKALRLVNPDKRIYFAISYLFQSSPDIRVYTASTIDEDLQAAGDIYLTKHMRIDVEKGEVGSISVVDCVNQH